MNQIFVLIGFVYLSLILSFRAGRCLELTDSLDVESGDKEDCISVGFIGYRKNTVVDYHCRWRRVGPRPTAFFALSTPVPLLTGSHNEGIYIETRALKLLSC